MFFYYILFIEVYCFLILYVFDVIVNKRIKFINEILEFDNEGFVISWLYI